MTDYNNYGDDHRDDTADFTPSVQRACMSFQLVKRGDRYGIDCLFVRPSVCL